MESIMFYGKFDALPERLKKEGRNRKEKKKKTPKFGSGKGMFEPAPDFDEPLEDFKEYMY
ncbi:MAG: DUF2281 domain-containing protein [bacterium]|nr:DUF2281 domain-containing protein [bacterium]